MHIGTVCYIIGSALLLEGALLLLPLGVAAIFGEPLLPFLLPALLAGGIGALVRRIFAGEHKPGQREGFVSTALVWVLLSLAGMLPFCISGAIPDPVDAFFETVSGFTTTGASILTAVEGLPAGILFWRSFLHWIGGMGILVFMMAIVPMGRESQMNLMKAESPGPTISKLVPRARDSARILYLIYGGMTVVTILLLLLFGMPLFDTFCIAFGAAGTGGFGILNSSCAAYTVAQQAVINIAMICFGINFNFWFFLCIGKGSLALGIEEVRVYLGIVLAAALLITADLLHGGHGGSVFAVFHEATFHVGSIITTTGYATTDCNAWPPLSQGILVLLMFCGACAGSTGGGFKVSRLVLLWRGSRRELETLMRPDTVKKVHMDGRIVEESVMRSTGIYCFVYMMIFFASVLLLAADGHDWVTTFTAVTATFNNIGPGLGEVGTAGNYAGFSSWAKLLLSADMLIGRLEIFPVIILFRKKTWRKF